MTRLHTLVTAFWLDLQAAFTASILHKIFNVVKAASGLVTYFFANVPTLELCLADLAAIRCPLVAEYISHELFAAIAEASHALQAWRAFTCVARHSAWVATFKFLLTRTFTARCGHSALNRWFKFGDAAGTPQRLS